MTKFLQERICTFLIHRYMGDYLKTELSTEQLQVKLRDGEVCVQNVGLNVEYINNTLEKAGLVSMVEGFVGEISLRVPLMNLLKESTVIRIRGLELTLTPLKEVNMTTTQDLVSSMIGSICSSSMDLARSVADEELFKDTENGGVEQFASMIDQVISRIKVIFEDTIIRLENESELCIGLEARIDKMEFVDEQLEACEQQKQSLETITSQPNSLYTVTDLNKLLHIQGVKLYTDIWTPEKDRCSTSSMNSSVDELSSPLPSLDLSMSSTSSAAFQSCYSHFSSKTIRFTTSKSAAGRSDISIPPNPIPFAQFFGDRNTVRIRVHNTALNSRDGAFNRKVDIEVQLGGSLYFLLTPSQLVLIQDILSKIVPKPSQQGLSTGMNSGVGGRPMQDEHFQQITGQFHTDRGWNVNNLLSRSPMGHNQTWGGGDIFYEMGSRNNPNRRSFADRTLSAGADLVSVPLDSQLDDLPLDTSTNYTDMDSADNDSLTDRTHHGSNSTLVERKPDVFGFSIKMPSCVGVITHEDPLDQNAIKKASTTENQTGVVCETITKMVNTASAFFDRATNLKLGVQSLQEQRRTFDYLYSGDHLRFVSKGVKLRFNSERNGTSDRIDLCATFSKCDFIEALLEKSVSAHCTMQGGITHVDILNFSLDSQMDLTFKLSTLYDRENDYTIEINMDQCKSEIDLSVIDRICHLLVPKPFFSAPLDSSEKGTKNDLEPNLALRDNLEPILASDSSASYQLMFNCPKWTIDFRIPIADLRESLVDYSIRNLHPEYLHLVIENAHLELPKFKASQITQHGSVKLDCNALTGFFFGDETVLECSKEEMKFLYASSKDRDARVGFKIGYDFRNKSLKVANHQPGNVMQKSMYEQSMIGSYFKFKDEDKIEGPFAQSKIFYENSKLIMAGNKEELKSFSENCRLLSNVNIEINVPNLSLCLPSHKFYEVVYNRFGNDLALFAPKAPVFKNSISPAANLLNPLINLDDRQFQECQSFHSRYEPDHDLDDSGPSDRTISSRKTSNDQTSSHDFTLSLNITKAKFLLQANVDLPESSFLTNLGTEIANAELFLVYGFHGNPDLAYFFIAAEKSHLYHRNIIDGLRPYEKNVTASDFCRREKADIHAEPLPSEELCTPVDDNNLAVSLKIHTYFDVKCNCYRKDIIVALAVRNTLIHFRPFRNPNHFWVQQFADFFNVVDYDVPGYVWPKTMIGLHLHLTSCLFGYDHSSVVENSPLKLRVEIGSCDISSNIVQNMEKYKFQCLLEELKVYLSAKKRQHSVNFDTSSRVAKKTSYVKLLSMGLLHLEVDYALPLPMEDGLLSAPCIEVICKNDLLKLWLCSDSLTEFINMISEFVESDVFASMTSVSQNPTPDALVQLVNEANMSASMMTAISNRNTIAGDLTEEDEERVMGMMNAAMQENIFSSSPKSNSSLRRESASSDIFNATKIPTSRSSHSFSSNNTDDEFIVVDEIPGSGITKPSGEPRTRSLDSFELIPTHFETPEAEVVSETVRLPPGHPPAIVKYEVRDFSILIYLYGGNDFGDNPTEVQTYSQWQTKRESPECKRDESLGGPFRDHTVCVEVRLEKISFLAEVFPSAAPILSLNMLMVQDVVVLDYVLVSNINKLFYQYTSQVLPRRSFAPLLSIRMVEDQAREGKLKISLLPIKVNFDQDTIEFLEDFFTYLGNNVRKPNIPAEHGNDTPIMEVPHQPEMQNRPGRTFSMASTGTVSDELAVRMSNLEEAFAEEGSSDMYPNLPSLRNLDEFPESPPILDDLFSDEDVKFEDSTYSSKLDSFDIKPGSLEMENMNDLMTTIMLESRKVEHSNNPEDQADDNSTIVNGSTVTRRTSSSTLRAQQMNRETFFKEFTFSPACTIAIDYNGKRVHTKKGALMGLLLGLSSLNKAELTLKELYNPKGMIGYSRCIEFAIKEWYNDISRNQIGEIVGSYGPMSSLKHIAFGIRDLFVMPLVEYRKEDGRVVKGIQKGASSFGISAAAATIDATQRLASVIQGVAELAFDIVTPDPYLQHRRRAFIQRTKVPTDIREGLHMAYDTIAAGVRDTSDNLQNALQEDRASGHWPIRGLLRQATPAIIRPIVIASQATVQVLSGVKNQIKPEDRREELEKWRYADPNRYKALMSKYHKS